MAMPAASRHKICALLPGLSTEVGHIYHYNRSVQKAVESLGWEFEAWIPKKVKIADAPLQWKPTLANDYWDAPKSLFFCLKMLIMNVLPLSFLFNREKKNKNTIIFIEHFSLQNIASIFISLLFLKPTFQFWILHRYAYGEKHFKTRIYQQFHWFLEKKLGANRVRILTDSDLLAKEQRLYFSRDVSVVPIPHTAIGEKKGANSPYLFWWPGGSMREDKGLSSIRRLSHALPKHPNCRLVVAEQGKSVLFQSDSLIFTPSNLSSEDYIAWMKTADLVLLPYSAKDYAQRTSGIFVEAICLGSIPVVSERTWMAYELSKYNLTELALTLEQLSNPDFLISVLLNEKTSEKLSLMRDRYRKFHSENGFAAMLKHLSST